MREIKCRGKRIDNGEWVYGNLVYMHGLGGAWTTGIQMPSGDGYRPYGSINVDPETVGLYTGLTDRNGKEIYEGDIIQDEDGQTGVVMYDDSAAGYFLSYVTGASFVVGVLEVIGNIYENPELKGE